MVKKQIYFDNAASTRVHPEVADLMCGFLLESFGNASSTHQVGRRARVLIEQSRRVMAQLLNAQGGQLFFTSGGTEANNAVLHGCHFYLGRTRFITSLLEHPSVLRMLEFLQSTRKCEVQFVNHSPKGIIDLDHLENLIQNTPKAVVSLMHANNETGNVLDLKIAGAICHKHGALFHSDVVQTAGKMRLDFEQFPVDFASLSAHKFHGPQGIGAVFIRQKSNMGQFVHGGNQERSLRAGTENVPGIIGMSKALEISMRDLEGVSSQISAMRKYLIESLPFEVPGISFAGDPLGTSLHTILNVLLPYTVSPDLILPKLDLHGICVSSGSACASGSNKPSAVLTAMGIPSSRANLRISLSRFNTIEECTELVSILRNILG